MKHALQHRPLTYIHKRTSYSICLEHVQCGPDKLKIEKLRTMQIELTDLDSVYFNYEKNRTR